MQNRHLAQQQKETRQSVKLEKFVQCSNPPISWNSLQTYVHQSPEDEFNGLSASVDVSYKGRRQFLLDTGSSVNIRQSLLDSYVSLRAFHGKLTGISSSQFITPLGIITIPILLNRSRINVSFVVVPGNIDLIFDGIFGLPFLKSHQATVFF